MPTNDRLKIDLDGFEVAIDPEPAMGGSEEKKSYLRGSFRAPRSHADGLKLKLRSEFFEILNISETGLQVLLQREDQFQAGQPIDHVEIYFSKTSLQLKGEVIHVSQIDLDRFALGLKLEFPNEAIREEFIRHHGDRLRNLIKRQKEFKSDQKNNNL